MNKNGLLNLDNLITRKQKGKEMDKPDKKSVYKDAGVDIDAASDAVSRMKKHIESTQTSKVLSGIGLFGALFDLSWLPGAGYKYPILVSSIDGVGTKTMIAERTDEWLVGQDIVNHCINDTLTTGAQPLLFMDYIAAATLKPKTMEKIVANMAIACKAADIPLIGGETAEMPGVYQQGRHDIVGCIVGIVEKAHIIDGSKIQEGDLLIGLESNGLHTNGYSLARKVFFETLGFKTHTRMAELGCPVGEELLKVHRSYLPVMNRIWQIQAAAENVEIHGIAHITGGGFFDNISRLLPRMLYAEISTQWHVPPVFKIIQRVANVPDQEMRRVFNLGIGMVLILPENSYKRIGLTLDTHWIIGKIKRAKSEQNSQQVIFTY